MIFFLLIVVVALAYLNFHLWRSGTLREAEHPVNVVDKPVMDAKERKAILKRLHRWKEEGKLTPSEYDRFQRLCDSEWDPS